MKSYMNSWRGFINESKKEIKQLKIKKIDGSDPMVDIKWESENWFIWNMGKVKGTSLWSVNHKASGAAIPSNYYIGGLGAAKKLITNVLEPLNLPDISSNTPSDESIAAIRQALIDSEYVNPILSFPSMSENMIRRKIESDLVLLEFTSAETVSSFDKFASAVGDVSSQMQKDSQESEKIKDLYDEFDKYGLGDFLEQIEDVETLMAGLDDPKAASEAVAGLQKLDMDPKEIGDKLEMIQIIRDEFDKYKQEQEDAQIERDEVRTEKEEEATEKEEEKEEVTKTKEKEEEDKAKEQEKRDEEQKARDEEQDKAMKDSERERTDKDLEIQAKEEEAEQEEEI